MSEIGPNTLCKIVVPSGAMLGAAMAGKQQIAQELNGSLCTTIEPVEEPTCCEDHATVWRMMHPLWWCDCEASSEGLYPLPERWLHPLPPVELPLHQEHEEDPDLCHE